MIKKLALMFMALMIACMGASAENKEMDARVDEIFRGTKTVGGAFVVAQRGEIV